MSQIHCNKEYHRTSNPELKTFADGVETGYYGNNPPFTVLPLPLPAFQALIEDYDNKLSDYENGGEAQKGPFLLAKTALIDALDLLATETDKVADGNSELIILAGFEPTKTKGETVKPGQTTVTVKRGIANELISTCALLDGAKHYGCIVTEGAPLPEDIIIDGNGRIIYSSSSPSPGPSPTRVILDFNMQREKHFTDLIHDVTYYFYYYAVNAKGVGPMSEAVSMVCW
jgi:hypothetical protein